MKLKLNTVADLKPTSRINLSNGFLLCVGVKLAKPTVKDYYRGELGLDNPTEIIKIYTSDSVLFSDTVIDGFNGSDVVMTHPQGNVVTADNYKDHIIGTAKNVRSENGYLVADLTIKDKWAINAIQYDEIKQISLGYSAEIDMTAGALPSGASYDGQWVNMVADHVAVVREGRCGSDCAIGDEKTKKGEIMKVNINGIEFEVGDTTLAQAINNQSAELNSLKTGEINIGDTAFNLTENKALQATIDKLVGDNKALANENATLKANQVKAEDIEKLVADCAKTLDDAKKIVPSIVGDGKTVEAIKREVVTAKADAKLVQAIVGDVANAEQSAIDTAFKALIATADTKPIATDTALANLNTVADSKPEQKTFDKSKMWQ